MQSTDTPEAKAYNKEHKTLGGLLLSALDMEDDLAHSVYHEYMNPKSWPEDLDNKILKEIQGNLSTLLNDTEKHRNIITSLKSKLESHDKQSTEE